MMKNKRFYAVVCVLICIVTILQLSGCKNKDDTVRTFENGKRAEYGIITVVDLYGSWREMGRQYGELLKDELNKVYTFTASYAEANETNRAKAEKTVEQQKSQSSYTLREFFAGAAETSGLTEDQLQLTNAVERIAGLTKCSAAFVWDEYAKDNLVIGRNYDYGEIFKELSDTVAVTVYHPADGALATATFGYTGEIYAVNALNEKGIFMELNNGKPSASIKSPNSRITGTTLLFEMMFEADSLDYTEMFFNSSLCSSSYIINLADAKSAKSVEWCPIDAKYVENSGENGILVSTNHYVNPDWEFPVPTDETSWLSVTRYNNLVNLCKAGKGQTDSEKMMQIIDKTVEEGGAKNELTVYQLVVEPETLTVWIKVIGQGDWVCVDMAEYLLAR